MDPRPEEGRAEGRFACKQAACAAVLSLLAKTAIRPVSWWASPLGHNPSESVIALCDKDGWHLMPSLGNWMIITSWVLPWKYFLFFKAAYFKPREISLPLCPKAGYYHPSHFKRTIFSLQYLHYVSLNQIQNISFSFQLSQSYLGKTDLDLNCCISESIYPYGTLSTEKHL